MKLSQLSIRDILLVTFIVALAIGWWLDHASLHAQLKAAQQKAAKWMIDAEVYGKLLRELPTTGVDLQDPLVPMTNP